MRWCGSLSLLLLLLLQHSPDAIVVVVVVVVSDVVNVVLVKHFSGQLLLLPLLVPRLSVLHVSRYRLQRRKMMRV